MLKRKVVPEIGFQHTACPHLGEQKYYQGYVSENKTAEGVEMQFLTMSIEGFARWFMTFADYAVVIKPHELQDRVRSLFLYNF